MEHVEASSLDAVVVFIEPWPGPVSVLATGPFYWNLQASTLVQRKRLPTLRPRQPDPFQSPVAEKWRGFLSG